MKEGLIFNTARLRDGAESKQLPMSNAAALGKDSV